MYIARDGFVTSCRLSDAVAHGREIIRITRCQTGHCSTLFERHIMAVKSTTKPCAQAKLTQNAYSHEKRRAICPSHAILFTFSILSACFVVPHDVRRLLSLDSAASTTPSYQPAAGCPFFLDAAGLRARGVFSRHKVQLCSCLLSTTLLTTVFVVKNERPFIVVAVCVQLRVVSCRVCVAASLRT